jgi:hypothetical protein
MHNPSTNVSHLLRAYEIGKRAGLRYIYPGNIPARSATTRERIAVVQHARHRTNGIPRDVVQTRGR